jgi:sulfite reductase (ferredoxin)
MYKLPENLTEDIQYLGALTNEFRKGEIEPVKFKATRVPMGIYEQRKDGAFMVRIRCVGGYITPKQLKRVAEIAHEHQSGLLHLTTRQEIQIQNLRLNDTIPILKKLQEIGLASKGGGGNTVRNIMASVDSGINQENIFDVLPHAADLTSKLISESDSYNLPRKFKIAFSSSEKDSGFASFNDLGFIARIKDNKRGFRVLLGGSLGLKPMISYEIFDFAPEEELFFIAEAAKRLFYENGNRKNKHKARLRYVFYKLGKEEVFRLFHEIYKEIKLQPELRYAPKRFEKSLPEYGLVKESIGTPEFYKWKERYVNDQKQENLKSIIVPVEHGDIQYSVLLKLADFLSNFGEDVIRFSMRQNVHLRNIPQQYLGNVYNFLTGLGIKTNTPLLLNSIVTCTGADTCRLGICLSKGAGDALIKSLAKSSLNLDKLSDLRVNISGCPNSCGQHIAADLGFFGKVSRNGRMYPAYNIVAGARTGVEPKLAEIVGEISAHDLPDFTSDLFRFYLKKNDCYKSFSEYFEEEGRKEIAYLTAKYNSNIPDFTDDKNYYFDWGSDNIFSLVSRGVGECSAGLFDMIDVDLDKINKNVNILENTAGEKSINELLKNIVFSSARMLLITRGAEPKNTTEVYNAFLSAFIDAGLVSEDFRFIILMARDHEDYNFSGYQEQILSLAKSVKALYESMNDSLQFVLSEKKENIDVERIASVQKIERRNRDFRGIACPMNFVKTKIELSTLKSGELLDILLDNGEPIENVPGSVMAEGHKILVQKKINDHWLVTIQKV